MNRYKKACACSGVTHLHELERGLKVLHGIHLDPEELHAHDEADYALAHVRTHVLLPQLLQLRDELLPHRLEPGRAHTHKHKVTHTHTLHIFLSVFPFSVNSILSIKPLSTKSLSHVVTFGYICNVIFSSIKQCSCILTCHKATICPQIWVITQQFNQYSLRKKTQISTIQTNAIRWLARCIAFMQKLWVDHITVICTLVLSDHLMGLKWKQLLGGLV